MKNMTDFREMVETGMDPCLNGLPLNILFTRECQ